MIEKIRIFVADDERPAREFLKSILRSMPDANLVGEAESGAEAIEKIRELKPDLALLDLQMPEATGIEVVKALRKNQTPLVAFVTAFDEFAVQAFEVNAVDYLLKPIEPARLRETLDRAKERLEHDDWRDRETTNLKAAAEAYDAVSRQSYLERIPVKRRDEIYLIPVAEIASIVADGELLHITTAEKDRYVINYRLKDLESRLAPDRFVRLSRGAIANLDHVSHISPMPGGTYAITLLNGQEIPSSRLQSRILRERLLRL
ncbi:MAG: response regulator transcription factor [Acidobacteria bacterium]|nr:response regulator transcription factor [Acidobacteriota bacterium]MBK8150457.1 response regulator transcription factor [Acidobacteriota bacterium]